MRRIRNIFHMLAYAFQALDAQGYRSVATEEFDNVGELCAAILTKGVSMQLKRGMDRGYVEASEPLSSLRGRIEVTESLKTRSILRRQLVCRYDDLSVDTGPNRIVKATLRLLAGSDISRTFKKDIRNLMPYFSEVADIDPHSIDWNLRFDRNNQTYRMLVNVCWLVVKGLLQTQADGSTKLMDFLDEQRMCRLFERFILEYYRKEHPEIEASSPHIKWALDDGFDLMLPTMKSDVVLTDGSRTLVIDAKFYESNTQSYYDKRSIRSGNLYQIFTYVKNMQASHSSCGQAVSGMLLYATTDEEVQPDGVYQMSGNEISVKTLDLDSPFSEIRFQLDSIAEQQFGSYRSCNT